MLVGGVDGTKKGWVVVTLDENGVDAFGAGSIVEVLSRLEEAQAVAIDMPIGFTDHAEPGGRRCEKAARAILGRRSSSVFSSPCRAALQAGDYAGASAVNRASSAHGLGLSKQSHAIFPKMREIDSAIDPGSRPGFSRFIRRSAFPNWPVCRGRRSATTRNRGRGQRSA